MLVSIILDVIFKAIKSPVHNLEINLDMLF